MTRIAQLAIAFALLGAATAAGAGPTNVTIRSIGGADALCMDARGDRKGDGTEVVLFRCHVRENQRFTFTMDGKIREVESGKCLMALGEGERAPIVLDECEGTSLQRWNFVP